MEKNKIIYTIATMIILLFILIISHFSTTKTGYYNDSSSRQDYYVEELKEKKPTQKKQILERIANINNEITQTTDQVKIDLLAKEKEELMAEYTKIELEERV